MTELCHGTGRFKRLSRRRRGFGLLDAIGVILTTGILLSFASMVLSQAFRSHADALDHLQRARQLQTAGDRFRADVHAATNARVEDGNLLLDLGRGRTIRYDPSASSPIAADQSPTTRPISDKDTMLLTRTISEEGQEVGRDQLRLGGSQAIRWTILTDEYVPLVRCELMNEQGASCVWLSRLRGSETSPLSKEDIDPDQVNDKVKDKVEARDD